MKRGQPITKEVRKFVMDRARGLCEALLYEYGCGYTATEIHHRRSRARGGSNSPINLVALCHACHRAITEHKRGTERFRTPSYEREGERLSDST